jgi:hypothetical protein
VEFWNSLKFDGQIKQTVNMLFQQTVATWKTETRDSLNI